MKTITRLMLNMLLLLGTTDMTAQTFKLSGDLREMLSENATAARQTSDSRAHLSLIMKVTDAQQMAQVCDDYGMRMVTDLGHIAVVDVPVSQIGKAASDPRVVRMEKEGGFHFCLDEARKTANVNPVTNGDSPLPQAYTGKGIVVGVLDAGVQYNHPTFLDANGQTRFRKVWDFDDNDGQQEPVVLTNGADILARKYSYSTCNGIGATNHGSHVAGIATGSGRYRGMAPDCDILFSDVAVDPFSERTYELYSDYLLTGVKNMTDYATEHQQPLVVNISLGNNLGFSTEVKLLQEAFGLLTGPGRIIVAANGNEGNPEESNSYFHSGSNLKENIEFSGQTMPMNYDIIWKTGGALSYKLEIWIGAESNTETFSTTQLVDGMLPAVERSAYKMKFLQLDDAPDGKHIYKLRIIPNEVNMPFSVMASVTADQSFEAFSKMLNIASADPAEGSTISNAYTSVVPGVFPNVIAVGNYCNRVLPSDYYDDGSGNIVTDIQTGVMSPSSSWGPTWDGRNKPDVSAPGTIISSGNWYNPNNKIEVIETYDIAGSDAKETWVGEFGSSQASPTVAGIVALWLQAKPDLTPDDVLTVIKNTSHAIEPIPNNHSGAGIIDAYAGLCKILGLATAIPTLSKNQPAHVTFRLAGDMLYADGADDGTPVTVYSLSGTVLQNTTVRQGGIRLSGIRQGVYAVQLGKLGSTLIRL
jgi:hypothetical protein